jgi:hypothetical protein
MTLASFDSLANFFQAYVTGGNGAATRPCTCLLLPRGRCALSPYPQWEVKLVCPSTSCRYPPSLSYPHRWLRWGHTQRRSLPASSSVARVARRITRLCMDPAVDVSTLESARSAVWCGYGRRRVRSTCLTYVPPHPPFVPPVVRGGWGIRSIAHRLVSSPSGISSSPASMMRPFASSPVPPTHACIHNGVLGAVRRKTRAAGDGPRPRTRGARASSIGAAWATGCGQAVTLRFVPPTASARVHTFSSS